IEASGLAGAVRTDQGVNGAAPDTQVDAGHGQEAGEVLCEILGLENDLRAHELGVPLARILFVIPGSAPSPSIVGSRITQPVSSAGSGHKDDAALIDQRLKGRVDIASVPYCRPPQTVLKRR